MFQYFYQIYEVKFWLIQLIQIIATSLDTNNLVDCRKSKKREYLNQAINSHSKFTFKINTSYSNDMNFTDFVIFIMK